jgi:hypothetical protein
MRLSGSAALDGEECPWTGLTSSTKRDGIMTVKRPKKKLESLLFLQFLGDMAERSA